MRILLGLAAISMVGCKDSDADGTRDNKDCAPEDFRINPEAAEVCDGIDNNCNGQVDEDVAIVAYLDHDLDGFGNAAKSRRVCELPADGSLEAGDCNDADPNAFPGAPEVCNFLDDNCDGVADEGVLVTFYRDDDSDGHGISSDTTDSCTAPPGFADTSDDCDDTEPLAWTDAEELCDGVDNDCDASIDEDLEPIRQWTDADGDGYGDPLAPILACGPSQGVSDNNLDCDDTDPAKSPDTIEGRGNNVDDDCDGYIDEFGVGPGNEFATVDDALQSAPNGSVIQLDQGFHLATVDLTQKTVTFAGEGCDRTTLYADAQGTAVTADDDIIERLTVSGGTGTIRVPYIGEQYGGGILAKGGDLTVRDLCVEANSADRGGGIAVISGSLTASNVRLTTNTSTLEGAGLYMGPGTTNNVWGSFIVGNVAAASGGGTASFGANVILTNTVIAGNQCSFKGCGAYGGPEKDEEDVIISTSSTLFDQVTFHANSSDPSREGTKNGEAIYYDSGTLDITHSLFTGHLQPYVVIETTNSPVITKSFIGYRGNAGPDIDYESFQQDRIADDVKYAIDDPALPPPQWDLHLRAGSGFIDKGDPTRLDPDGTVADIGAYGGPVAPADWNFAMQIDEDIDGMLDAWEMRFGTNYFVDDSADDDDGDGLTNLEEHAYDSDPLEVDTDGDGAPDGVEAGVGTDPLHPEDQAPSVTGQPLRYTLDDEETTLSVTAFDPNGDALTYAWTTTLVPGGSLATPDSPTSRETTFTPDLPGTYILEAAVSDGGTTRSFEITLIAATGDLIPDDYPSVQEAIDDGRRTLGLRPGVYRGVSHSTEDLTLIGLGASEDIVLDGGGYGSTLDIEGASLIAAQLTVTGGFAQLGGGLHAKDAENVLFSDVTFVQNYAYSGGGLWLDGNDTELVLQNVRVIDNVAKDKGGGIWLTGEDAQYTLLVQNGRFAGNTAGLEGGALWLDGGIADGDADFYIYGTAFLDNEAPVGAAWWHSGRGSDINLWNSTLANNRGGSLGFSDEGRNIVLSDVLQGNEVTLLWDGAGVEWQHFDGVWADPTDPAFYDPLSQAALIPSHLTADPLIGSLTHDGDAFDDVIGPRLGSPVHNVGFIDHLDQDASRADVGGCGGPFAAADCARFAFDADSDSMADGWEIAMGLDPALDDSADDADGDGITNLEEHTLGTRADRRDSDLDGITDGAENSGAGIATDDRDHRPVAALLGMGSTGPARVEIGETLLLDGSASYDPDGNTVTYHWRLVGISPGSVLTDADLVGADQAQVTFSPDQSGAFRLGLTVDDGTATSRERIVWAVVPKELSVPTDFPTLAEAVLAAGPGDVIRLGPGTFPLAFNPQDLPLVIAGSGIDETTVEPLNAEPVFKVDSDGELEVRDLTIRGGHAYLGAGMRCEGGILTARRVVVDGGVAYNGGGLYAYDCTAQLVDVTFSHNHSSWSGGAVYTLLGSLDWTGGGASFNTSGYTGAGLVLLSTEATLRNLHIHRNQAENIGAAILTEYSGTTMVGFFDASHLTISGNRGLLGAIYRVDGIPFTLVNSSIVDNQLYGFYDAYTAHTGLTLNHNNWFVNTVNSNPLAQSLGGTDLRVNPLFVAYDPLGVIPDDVHLRDDSPLRHAGDASDNPDGSVSDVGLFGGADSPADWDVWFRDLDLDGMADGWEESVGLDPLVVDAALDPDGDTLTNLSEFSVKSDPFVIDSDVDGVSDDLEAGVTNPADPVDHSPSANAGADKTGAVAGSTSFTGTGVDPQLEVVSYNWTLYNKPGTSTLTSADLVGANTNVVSLTPDHAGQFVLQLVTSDGAGFSKPDFAILKVPGNLAVPADYPTVGQAVKAAENGATITIAAGTWPAQLDLDGKDIAFVGAGRDTTILDGQNKGVVLKAIDGEIVSLDGLTLAQGRNGRGGAAWLDDGSVLTATDVSFRDNTAGEGGALYIEASSFETTGVRIVDNFAGYRGGGINATATASLDLLQTLIANNNAVNSQGGGIRMVTGGLVASNVIFSDNVGYDGGGIYITSAATATMDHVTATFNDAAYYGAFVRVSDSCSFILDDSIVTLNHNKATISETSTAVTTTLTYSLLAGNDLDLALVNSPLPVDGVDGNQLTTGVADLVGLTDDGDWTNDDWSPGPASTALDLGDPLGALDPDGSAPDLGAFGGASGDWVP